VPRDARFGRHTMVLHNGGSRQHVELLQRGKLPPGVTTQLNAVVRAERVFDPFTDTPFDPFTDLNPIIDTPALDPFTDTPFDPFTDLNPIIDTPPALLGLEEPGFNDYPLSCHSNHVVLAFRFHSR